MVTPVGTFAPLQATYLQQHVFFQGDDNGIYQIFYDGTGALQGPEQWARDAVGNPATMYSYSQDDNGHTPGQQHVFYRDANGYIWQVYYDENLGQRHGPEQWVGPQHRDTDVLAASDPACLWTFPEQQQHVFYRGTSGGIYQVFYDPGDRRLHGPEQWL